MLKNGILLIVVVVVVAAAGVAAFLWTCGLPSQDGRQPSRAITTQQGADTTLGRNLAPLLAEHPGLSGVVPLSDPLGAFAARMRLISSAQRTIDVQYYIWRNDITGNLLLQALHEAAQRGVRVRLLVDDNGINGFDAKLALLNAEPDAQVRLFNPFPFRRFKRLSFLADFSRLNRRMHNKAMTVDGQVTIVGGRNIGDEYFGATQGVAFTDLDVMVAGRVVDAVSHDFDRYWSSESAYPLDRLVTMPDKSEAWSLRQEETGMALSPEAHAYVAAVKQSAFIQSLLARELAFDWVPVRMVSDDPGKVLGRAPPEATLMARLMDVLGKPRHSVDLISPYFVPTQQGVEAFAALEKQGVRIRILTNSLEATDVTAAFAGYAKCRRPLLERGITLFEMRREAGPRSPKEKAGPLGSSGASLHAKTFAVDGTRVFVGSFNFDPRSALLNTELGFVIDSESMARAMAGLFNDRIPNDAYQLGLDGKGNIVWRERTPRRTEALTVEPNTSFWRRLTVRFLSWLPIEHLL